MTKNIKIQLYGKVEGYLTLTENSDFPFTLALSDIKDLSKRKSTTSKSIEIAGTDENNRILSYYFDVNVDPNDLYFNINKIQKCCIYINDDMFMDNCIMQLTDIKKVQPNSQREYSIVYTINIKSNQADFFGAIQNKNLEDIEFTTADIPGNAGAGFIYNSTFVKNSFNNTYTDGYKFLYQKTTSGKITLPMFKPATYLWTYWNRIIKDAGFRYTFPEIGVTNSVLTDPSKDDLYFRKLLVPFTNKVEGTNMQTVVNYAAQAAKTGAAIQYVNITADNISPTGWFETTAATTSYIIANTNEINDPSNSYTPTQYTSQFTGTLTVNVGQRYQAFINNINAAAIYTYTGPQSGYAKIRMRNTIYKNGQNTGIQAITGNVTITNTSHTWNVGRTSIGTEDINASLSVNVIPGDVITVLTTFVIEEGEGVKRHRMVTTNGGSTLVGDFRAEVDVQSMTLSYVASIQTGILNYGNIIDMNKFIPQKIKQSDFFKSILNMHNIYVYADKYDENLLHFTTRDKYYDNGVKKDFTSKFIKDMEHSDQFLSEISNKKMYMSYKQDKYIDNETYFNEYNKTYGSATFVFDNEYVKDEDKLEIIFSPSPINMDGDKYVTDLTTQDSLRLLFDTGETSCNSYKIVNYPGNESTATTYPITTHFDNCNTPTYDLNFGTAESYFHNYSSMTSTNLINTYWRRTLHQINKSRLFTCYLYLTEVDIRNIALNDIIYIENAYYYINKIIDFNPVKTYKTKVELISIDDLQSTTKGIIINLGNTKPVEPWVPTPNGGTVKPHIYGNIIRNFNNGNAGTVGGVIGIGNAVDSSAVVIGDNNASDGKGSIIVGNYTFATGNMIRSYGDRNNINGNNVQVSGVDNVITANNVISNGDDNVLDSPGLYFGSNITAPANLGNVIVVGDNITATSSGIWSDNINGIPTSTLTSGLPGVLSIDNTTGGNNIIMTGGDSIVSDTSNAGIILSNAISRIVAIDSSIMQAITLDAISNQEIALQTTDTSTSDTSVLRIGAGSTLLLSLDSVGLGRLDVTTNTSFLTHQDLVNNYSSRFQALGEEASMYGTNGVTIYKVLATGSGIKFVENTTDILEANLTDIIFYNNTRLDYTPVTNNTNTKVLSRNTSTGDIEERTVASIISSRLTAWDAYNTNGILVQTSATTWQSRTITGPGTGITVTNGNGVSGNPTLTLANDLAALEGLASTGFAVRTGTDTWTQRTITAGTGITVTNGNGVSGNPTIAITATSLNASITSISTNTTISNDVTLVDTTSTTITVTLPTAVGISGKQYTIKDKVGNAGIRNITVATTSSQTIDGSTTQRINTGYESLTVISDGSNWYII